MSILYESIDHICFLYSPVLGHAFFYRYFLSSPEGRSVETQKSPTGKHKGIIRSYYQILSQAHPLFLSEPFPAFSHLSDMKYANGVPSI